MINEIFNEDETIFNPPKNPLQDKWDKLYPPTKNGKPCSTILGYKDDGTPIMNYSCVLCIEKKCQHSSFWEVPEEDKEIYEEYMEQRREYFRIHNPEVYDMCFKNRE